MNPFIGTSLIMGFLAFFHGLTARERARSAICSRLGLSSPAFAFIRSCISLSALILSVIYLFSAAPATGKLFEPIYGMVAIVPTMFAFWIAGMALGQVGKSGRMAQFFGLKEDPKVFFFTGAFSICRHPMYAGWLIASWGLVLSKPYLLTVFYNVLLSAFVIYQCLQEEKRMIALFADKYIEYRKKTPFIIPYGFVKSR